MNSKEQLNGLIMELAQKGATEIAIIKLPSQINKKQKSAWMKNCKGVRAKSSAFDRIR